MLRPKPRSVTTGGQKAKFQPVRLVQAGPPGSTGRLTLPRSTGCERLASPRLTTGKDDLQHCDVVAARAVLLLPALRKRAHRAFAEAGDLS